MSNMKHDFDVELFETRLENLKDTQDGIQQMSAWCLQQKSHHKKIVSSWLNVLKKVRVEHRLILFYLANDVVQNSKRKRYDFVESWATALQRATTMVRDEKVRNKIFRIFQIWEERDIYSEEYLSDLRGLLSMNPSKKSQASSDDVSDFQNSNLISKVRECMGLALSTDKSLKNLPKAPNCDIDYFKALIKDKSHSDDVEKEIEQYIAYVETYNKNLTAEIRSRKLVIANLETAMQFYASQRVDVKVVVSAYKNFGSRIKLVKKKLDEITPNLPSPIPSPDINAPSPEPDADLTLPDEQPAISMNIFKNAFNGYSSYLDGNLPFDINDFKRDENVSKINSSLADNTASSSSSASQPIEVIASRPDDQIVNNRFDTTVQYYKPDSMSPFSSIGNNNKMNNNGNIPMPVPPVQSEYSSLAQASATSGQYQPNSIGISYSGIGNLRPNHGHNLNDRYNPMIPNYGAGEQSYMSPNSSNRSYDGSSMPLLPPPMPPTALGGQQNDDFNSTWEMDMSWTPLDTSNSFSHIIDTPISPPHFDQEGLDNNTPIEYSEHSENMMSLQDVDHRQLHLPPGSNGPPPKLGLSQEKTRQLDIDHRNLISLTGSPNTTESASKYSWLSSTRDKDLRSSQLVTCGDTDYRSSPALLKGEIQEIKTIETIPPSTPSIQPPPIPPGLLELSPTPDETTSSAMPPPNLFAMPKKSSPQKISESSESNKDESTYDPNDMVESIDMDLSDEDLDDLFREVITEQKNEQEHNEQLQEQQDDSDQQSDTLNQEEDQPQGNESNERLPLLDTPEYEPSQNVWDQDHRNNPRYDAMNSIEVPGTVPPLQLQLHHQEQQQQQQHHQQQPWRQPPHNMLPPQFRMQNDENEQMFRSPMPPMPPMPLAHQQQQQQQMHLQQMHQQHQPFQPFHRGGRGGGRGFIQGPRNFMSPHSSSQNPFRNSPRGGSSPYFNRGRGMGHRGNFRGKFRGNNTWL